MFIQCLLLLTILLNKHIKQRSYNKKLPIHNDGMYLHYTYAKKWFSSQLINFNVGICCVKRICKETDNASRKTDIESLNYIANLLDN